MYIACRKHDTLQEWRSLQYDAYIQVRLFLGYLYNWLPVLYLFELMLANLLVDATGATEMQVECLWFYQQGVSAEAQAFGC